MARDYKCAFMVGKFNAPPDDIRYRFGGGGCYAVFVYVALISESSPGNHGVLVSKLQKPDDLSDNQTVPERLVIGLPLLWHLPGGQCNNGSPTTILKTLYDIVQNNLAVTIKKFTALVDKEVMNIPLNDSNRRYLVLTFAATYSKDREHFSTQGKYEAYHLASRDTFRHPPATWMFSKRGQQLERHLVSHLKYLKFKRSLSWQKLTWLLN